MKQTLLDNINKPIKLFKENGGIVGVCEKGGKFLGETLKGIFNVAKFIIEPPVSAVILAGLITVDYINKDHKQPLLQGDSVESIPNYSDSALIVDLSKADISKGAKSDIEQLLGLTVFDFNSFRNQYKKKLKQYHPDNPLGSESLFNEFQRLAEEIRWTWFVDLNDLKEDDKHRYQSMTRPIMRWKSYLYEPRYRNGQIIGPIKVINIASCADDVYYCRNIETDEIIELKEEELNTYA